MRLLSVLSVLAVGCMALPGPAAPTQSSQPAPCTCLDDLRQAEDARVAALALDPPAPQADPAHEAGSRTGALIRVVTGAGGLLTGNPPAWALIGQAASLALSLAGRLRRRPTA